MKAVKKVILFSLSLWISMVLMGTCSTMVAKAEEAMQTGKTTGGLQYTYNSTTGELVLTGGGTLSQGVHAGISELYDLGLDIKKIKLKNCTLSGGMHYAFAKLSSVESIVFENVDTSRVLSMRNMFDTCSRLESLDLSCFDTSNVIYMDAMFYDCISLKRLNISGFDTSNVEDMNSMFCQCTSLSSLDVSSFDTSKVRYMYSMFAFCKKLESLDLSGFNTSKVIYMDNMFNDCWKLSSLDVSGFDTSQVIGMRNMFDDCWGLKILDLSSFYIKKDTAVSEMFYYCSFDEIHSPYNTNGQSLSLNYRGNYYIDEAGNRVTSMTASGESRIYIRVGYHPEISITTQPKAVTAVEGTNATFKIVAKGSGLTYQWQYSQDNGSTWKNSGAASGVTATYVLGAKASRNGYLIRCKVTDIEKKLLISSEVKLTVTSAGPVITTQPKAVTAVEGTNATFKIVATGKGLTYQWQYSQDNGSTWKNSGAASGVTATYVLGAKASRNGYLIRCKVKDSSGITKTSNAVKLTVTSAGPVITTQPKAVTAVEGTNATFKIVATGKGLTYQWQYSQDNGSTWKNSGAVSGVTATYVLGAKASRNGYLIRCKVKDSSGITKTSSAVKLTVTAAK